MKNTPPKVLMYYAAHWGSQVDGTMTIALNIAKGFSLAKIPSIFIFNGHPDIFRLFEETGVDVRRIEMPKPGVVKHFNPIYRRRFSRKLVELISKEGIDVLHLGQREAYILNYVKKFRVLKGCHQNGGILILN